MSDYSGIYKAVVFDAADPFSKGRVRLLVPAILGKTPTGWAEPVSGAGKAGEVVWAMFDSGDLNRPIYLTAKSVLTDTDQQFEAREVGEIIMWGSDVVPDGWMLCDGAAISRTEYADLYARYGTRFGTGNGSTTFNLPNLKGRMLVGKDTAQTDFDTLGKTGGAKTVTLTEAQIPSHRHGVAARPDGTNVDNGSFKGGVFNYGDGLTGFTGGGQAHENMPPFMVGNYLIRVKKLVPAIISPPTTVTLTTAAKVATTANITLSGTQTIDGVAVGSGDVVLVWLQTNQVQNGVYVVSTGTWTRHPDYNTGEKLAGQIVRTMYGTRWGGWTFKCQQTATATPDTDPIVFSRLSPMRFLSSLELGIGPTANVGIGASGILIYNLAAVTIPAQTVQMELMISPSASAAANCAGYFYLHRQPTAGGAVDTLDTWRIHNNGQPRNNYSGPLIGRRDWIEGVDPAQYNVFVTSSSDAGSGATIEVSTGHYRFAFYGGK